ncbi:hypothetical protein ACFYO1_18360 [Nocardia sp. NPDC006044]|uniref:hypothetical protein n=1 Tax=Nocardia sp. NPDC006044 TaxID=3364306 RepID=UPI0036774DED
MKKTFAGLAVIAVLVAPAAAAAPIDQTTSTLVADSGSASAGDYLCRLLRMLRAGWVDSSGGGPACTFP